MIQLWFHNILYNVNYSFQFSIEDVPRSHTMKSENPKHLHNIDTAFIVLFPIIFLLFNFSYWIAFLKF